MKSLFCRLKPDSLPGQVFLVTLLGIALMQGMNYYTICSVQYSYRLQAEKNRAVAAASYYFLLNGLEPGRREAAVESLMAARREPESGLHLALSPQAPDWDSQSGHEARLARELLLHSLGEDESGEAVATGVDAARDVDAERQIWIRVLEDPLPESKPARRARFKVGPLLETAVRLDDGAWMSVAQPLFVEDRKSLWTQRLMVLLELLAFGGVIVALLSRVTRPLCRMSRAAEAFGRHPEGAEPLVETGSREVREAAQSFNRMRERILDALAERRRMLAAMGHDLRTPLTRAKLRLEEIEPLELRERFAANLGEIQSIVEQGLELAGSLQTSEEPALLEINAFVESLADDASEEGRPVEVLPVAGREATDKSVEPLVVRARPVCLKRCLDNLLSNAAAYADGARIAVSRQPDSVLVDILDQGPGIPEDMLEKVFEPYFRLEGSRNRDSGGAGLGLSIARNMAALCGGSLVLQNRPEGGLRARLTLPRVK